MTKRVYELAQEMNVDKEELLTEIRKLNIQVPNTASILEEEEVVRVLDTLSHRVKMTTITEKRIRPGVIRRRVKQPVAPTASEVQVDPGQLPTTAVGTIEAQPEESVSQVAVIESVEREPETVPEITEPQKERAPSIEEAEAALPAEERAEAAPTAEVTEEIPAFEIEEPLPEPRPEKVSVEEEPSAEKAEEAETAPSEEISPLQEPDLQPREVEEEPVVVREEAVKPPREAKAPLPRAKKKKRDKKMEPARVLGRVELSKEIPAQAAAEPPVQKTETARPGLRPPAAGPEKRKRPTKKEEIAAPAPPPVTEEVGRRKAFRKKKEVVKKKDLYEKKDRLFYSARKEDRKLAARKMTKRTEITTPKAIKRRIKVYDTISLAELAKRLQVKSSDLIKELMKMGVMASINQMLEFDIAALVAAEFGYEAESVSVEHTEILEAHEDRPDELFPRQPVVTVMGHVDHGKTALLDAIRDTHVMEGEAGGITQHIGAYTVSQDGNKIVFIDTPGHEAFTAMRARGAKVTDIVVLVVAADDGVMAQTEEAIAHARAANVPIVVAINKIDKANANPDLVRKALAERQLIPEEWGGDVLFAEVSAKEKMGIDQLLENILLQAEILDLKANPNKPARGIVIESRMERGRGAVATVLVQDGTLRPGDFFISGTHTGKVRALLDENGIMLTEASPSTPVEVQGFPGIPLAGEEFLVVTEEKKARDLVEYRTQKLRQSELAQSAKITLEGFYDKIKEDETKELNIIIKADTQGSLEALSEALVHLSTEKVKTRIIHGAVGTVTENDVMLASASQAIIVGFHVKPDPRANALAEHEGIQIQHYSIIYDVIDQVHKAMEGLLAPLVKEVTLGRAEVRHLFTVKAGLIAGCTQLEGIGRRGGMARLIRGQQLVREGKVVSLKRFKDDVREVSAGFEFGFLMEGNPEFQINDIIEFFEYKEEAASL